jgi:GDPmannose 4,6-dehydratase
MNKTALIAGITGQDGAYLAHHLLQAGYRVIGSSRDAQTCNTSRLSRLGILQDVEVISIAPNDFRSVLKALSCIEPAEIYNLAGQTSVGLSFEQPVECMESIAGGTLNILEVLRYLGAPTRMFSAGSSECFGDTSGEPASEQTAFHPRSPYAVAKSTAYWQVANYRQAYGMFCCTGILANHESPLRPNRFVTMKIIAAVREIERGERQELKLGNLDIWRDWGWAQEYVVAMHKMLQAPIAKDYLIATGKTNSLNDFVRLAFASANLNPERHLTIDDTLLRPSDLRYSAMNPDLIASELAWKAKIGLPEIVQHMLEDKIL